MLVSDFGRVRQMHAGFGMVEVLVTLVVVALGLLGLAGMQSVAISNSGVARMRSIAAIQANSIVAAMSANPVFWTNPSATLIAPSGLPYPASSLPINYVVTGGATPAQTTIAGTPTLPGYTDCTAAVCTAAAMATYDLSVWGASLYQQMGTGSASSTQSNATINCSVPAGTGLVSCKITVYWVEKTLAAKQSSAVSATAGNTYDFSIVVQP